MFKLTIPLIHLIHLSFTESLLCAKHPSKHQRQGHEQVRQGLCPPGGERLWNKQVLWEKWVSEWRVYLCLVINAVKRNKAKWIKSDREGLASIVGIRKEITLMWWHLSKTATRRKGWPNYKNSKRNTPKRGTVRFVRETAKSSDSILRVTGSFWRVFTKRVTIWFI